MFDLDQVIRERHSTRLFLPQPVPRALVDEALALAQHAPSNSDIQPWHVVFASGARRDRFIAALLDAARSRPPNIPPLPEGFQHYRRELGAEVYGAMGISITDAAGHQAAVLRNWEFFRAHRLHAPRPRPCRRCRRGHVFTDLVVGPDRTWSRQLCR